MKNGTYETFQDNSLHGEDGMLTRELGPYSVLDAVLDGVSTAQGHEACRLTLEKLTNEPIKGQDDIINILRNASHLLYVKNPKNPAKTTATVSLKTGNRLFVANVGDSPAYLIRGDEIIDLTVMDKMAPGPNYDPRIITKAVGEKDRYEFECNAKTIELRQGDKLALMTDGISDNLYPYEIAAILNEQKNPEAARRAIKKLLYDRQLSNTGRRDAVGHFKPDDQTLIIRYFTEEASFWSNLFKRRT